VKVVAFHVARCSILKPTSIQGPEPSRNFLHHSGDRGCDTSDIYTTSWQYPGTGKKVADTQLSPGAKENGKLPKTPGPAWLSLIMETKSHDGGERVGGPVLTRGGKKLPLIRLR
jgi:hypothetical protein